MPDSENPLEGRYEVVGSAWYEYMGQYKIKCCRTDRNKDQDDELPLAEVESENWTLVDSGSQPQRNDILGHWNTAKFDNGDYLIKIEVYDDIGRLHASGIITKDVDVDRHYPIVGRGKGQTLYFEEKSNIKVNWPGDFPFEFVRIYHHGLRKQASPMWFGWTHNHNIRLMEDLTSDWAKNGSDPNLDDQDVGFGYVWLIMPTGTRMFEEYGNAPGDAEISYVPVDGEPDYIVRTTRPDTPGIFSLYYEHYAPDGTTMTFKKDGFTVPANGVGWKLFAGIDRKTDRFGNYLRYSWQSKDLDDDGVDDDWYITQIVAYRHFYENTILTNKCAGLFFDTWYSGGDTGIYACNPADPTPAIVLKVGEDEDRDGDLDDQDLISIQREQATYTLTSSIAGTKYESTRWCMSGTADTFVILDTYHWDNDNELKEARENVLNEDVLIHEDHHWLHPSTEYEFYPNGELKTVRYCADWLVYGTITNVGDYSYEYDESGNLTTTVEYRIVGQSSPVSPSYSKQFVYKKDITTSTAKGAVLESKTISYQNPYVDPCDYGEFVAQIYVLAGSPLSYYAEGVHSSGGRLGGGGTSKTEYLYEDPNFPLKPTWIIETYDDDADGDYDGRSHRINLTYDDNGNVLEKRDYVNSQYSVLTEYDYHDYYSGLKTRETTWQGLCYESGGSVVRTGQKVETRYIYGDKDGNLAEETQDANHIYFLKEIKLLEEGTPDVEAEIVYTYEHDGDPNNVGKTNQVSSTTDANGNIDFYEYDERGFVKAVWKGATLTNGEPQGNPQKRYHYNEVGLCALEADYLGKVTERIYDDFGNVAVSNVYEEANPNSISLGFEYGGEFNPYTGDPNDTYHERYGGEFLSKTRYRGYNAYRKPALVDLPYGDYTNKLNYRDKVLEAWMDYGSSWSSSHSFFSPGDNLQYYNHIKTMAADGVNCDKACTFLLYDSLSRPVHKYYAIADGDDNDAFTVLKHEEYAYDGAGNKTQEKVYALELQGNTYTSTLEKHTVYEYDLLKRLIKRTEDPDGLNLVRRYGYDATGNTIYTVDPEGHVAFVDYDNANRKTQEYFNEEAVYYTDDIIDIGATKYNAVVKTEYVDYKDDSVKSVTRYDYDYDGDGEGGELAYTEFTYDGRGRIESVKEKIDDVPTYATTTIDYNDAGFDPCNGDYNNVCITDAVGQETYMSYEVHGKVDKISYPSGDYEEMTYYGHGLLKTKTVWDNSGDPCLVEYEYDDFGKLKEKIYPDNGGYLEYEYTGRVLGKFGRVNRIKDYRAAADRPVPADARPAYDFVAYEFEYNYPVSSQITSYTVNTVKWNEQTEQEEDETLWYKVLYDYSPAYGKKTRVEAYDAGDNTIYHVNYDYDMAGRLESVEAHNGTTGFDDIADCSYYPDGTRQQLTYYLNGTTTLDTSYEYNPDNSLTRISALVGADSKYLFDAGASVDVDGLGRLIFAGEQIKNTLNQTVTHELSFYDETAGKPGYDMRSQLLYASISDINGGTWLGEYTYQDDGNIEEKEVNGQSDSFEYNTTAGGSVFDSDIMTEAYSESLAWNDNGQLETGLSSMAFVYNWDGKLCQAAIGANTVELKYDPMGNRVYKSVNSDPCEYIVDISGRLPTILCEIKASDSSLKKSYIYSNNGQILCQRDGGQSAAEYFYVSDRLGSVRLVVNSSGTVLNTYTYDPFGEAFSSECETTSPVDDNPFMFTGQWYDSEIAQYYLRARMYDPQLMRFTARDPVRGKFNHPMSLHKYLYCLNDPINRIDPMGKWSLTEVTSTTSIRAGFTGYSMGVYGGVMSMARSLFVGAAIHGTALSFMSYSVASGSTAFFHLGLAMERLTLPMMSAARWEGWTPWSGITRAGPGPGYPGSSLADTSRMTDVDRAILEIEGQVGVGGNASGQGQVPAGVGGWTRTALAIVMLPPAVLAATFGTILGMELMDRPATPAEWDGYIDYSDGYYISENPVLRPVIPDPSW